MEVEIFTMADYANDSGNGKMNIIGTFDTIAIGNVPCIQPQFAIAARIRIANTEAGRHDFEIVGLNPNGGEFQRIRTELEISPSPHADYNTINLPVNIMNFNFEAIGRYAFELYIDGEFRSGLSLHVILINQGPRLLAVA